MTITYELKDNLYVNVTNRCSNNCDFCVRNLEGKFSHDLYLTREPTVKEIIEDIFSRNLKKYKQIVFCGLGEPLERIDEVIAVCRAIKEKNDIRTRINTNGLANRIHNYDVTPKFKTLVDAISISLNAKNAKEYDEICHSIFGEEAFSSILDFTEKCKLYVSDVQLSIVDCLSTEDIKDCKKIAEKLRVNLKIRKEIK